MTKIASLMRGIARTPVLAGYHARHLRNSFRIAAMDAAEWWLAFYAIARSGIYKRLGLVEPVSLSVQRDRLVEFYGYYEDLVDVLCIAARFEDTSAFEAQYGRLRNWMIKNYPNVRPFLIAHLMLHPSDDMLGLNCVGKPSDGFEALFVAPSITQLLKLDQGDLIERIYRTRDALNRYGDHLRRNFAA
ncbi:MAG: hypothetical protein WCO51_02745 [bacterium]